LWFLFWRSLKNLFCRASFENDLLFCNYDLSEEKPKGCWQWTLFLIKYIFMWNTVGTYFYNYGLDMYIAYCLFTADHIVYPNVDQGGVAYGVFSLLSFGWLVYNLLEARSILSQGKICETYVHQESYRLSTLFSIQKITLYSKVSKGLKDHWILFLLDSMYQLPQIIFVRIPQLILIFYFNQPLQAFHISKAGSFIATLLKLVLLVFELGARVAVIQLSFPWVMCCLSKNETLYQRANHMIKKHMEELLEGKEIDGAKLSVAVESTHLLHKSQN